MSLRELWTRTREQAEQDWAVSARVAALCLALPWIAALIAGVLSIAFKPTMRFLEQEDGPMEWFQVLAFGLGALAAIPIAVGYLREQRRLTAAAYGVLAAGLVFIVGEELAWGQRILEFGTPAALAEVNEKQEVSLHNIRSVTGLFKLLKLGAALYGVLGALLLLHLRRKGKDEALRPFVPPGFLAAPFAVLLVMRLARLSVLRHTIPTGYSEFEETVVAAGLAAFCLLAARARKQDAAR